MLPQFKIKHNVIKIRVIWFVYFDPQIESTPLVEGNCNGRRRKPDRIEPTPSCYSMPRRKSWSTMATEILALILREKCNGSMFSMITIIKMRDATELEKSNHTSTATWRTTVLMGGGGFLSVNYRKSEVNSFLEWFIVLTDSNTRRL